MEQSGTRFIAVIDINLATPKTEAKHELLFNKPASGHTSSFKKAIVYYPGQYTYVLNNL